MPFLDKKSIRQKKIKLRNNMKKEEVEALSRDIMEKITKLPMYKKSKTVMLYLSFNNEVDSYEMIRQCLENGKRVVVPYCIREDKTMIATEIKDLEALSIRKDELGYAEPTEESLSAVSTDEIDLIIVPGVAFDKKCYRVGFGAGYYDRFLGKLNFKIPTIGVSYDFQIIESFLEMEEHDIPLDYILTEKRIIIRSE